MENYDPKPRYFNVNKEPIIGKNVSLVNTLLECAERIVIGDNVAFGHDCQILTGSHMYEYKGAERMSKSRNISVWIGDGVWIASRVTICQGVNIGENAVICAGAVVIHDVPKNQMWGGVPAKFIKNI